MTTSDFLYAFQQWIPMAPQFDELQDLAVPQIVNQILKCTMDSQLVDYSLIFLTDDKTDGRKRYFQCLFKEMAQNYYNHRAAAISRSFGGSYSCWMEAEEAPKSGSGFRYYYSQIDIQKLCLISEKTSLDSEDYYQMQMLFSMIVEVAFHGDKSPLCLVSVNFLDQDLKEELKSVCVHDDEKREECSQYVGVSDGCCEGDTAAADSSAASKTLWRKSQQLAQQLAKQETLLLKAQLQALTEENQHLVALSKKAEHQLEAQSSIKDSKAEEEVEKLMHENRILKARISEFETSERRHFKDEIGKMNQRIVEMEWEVHELMKVLRIS